MTQDQPARMTESPAHRARTERAVELDTLSAARRLYAQERGPAAPSFDDLPPVERQPYLTRARRGQ